METTKLTETLNALGYAPTGERLANDELGPRDLFARCVAGYDDSGSVMVRYLDRYGRPHDSKGRQGYVWEYAVKVLYGPEWHNLP